jgi:hypothetical protein
MDGGRLREQANTRQGRILGAWWRRSRAALRSLLPSTVFLLPSVVGCAYYNGLYNAKVELAAGDRLSRAGRESEAGTRYAVAAAKAETVLVRYPRSRWRGEALRVAGRAAALGGDCRTAGARLVEALAQPSKDTSARELLLVAQGVCLAREARPLAALELLEPLSAQGQRDVRPVAALWAARAAIALGDAERARRVLGALDAGAAQWELAHASITARRFAVAESLLALRAARGDVRPDLSAMLRSLWTAGERDALERLVTRYHAAGTRAGDLLALHMLAAELQTGSGLDDLARRHLLAARRLAVDSVSDAEAAARLTLLSLAPLSRLEDVAAAIRRGAASGRPSLVQRRLEDNLLLLELLAGRTDASGASLYLAAEVARDSLRAPYLAVQLFRRVDQALQGALMAPRALFSAAVLAPDSAPALHARLRERYPRAPWTLALDGASAAEFPAWEVSEQSLRVAWNDVAVQFADSLARLRAPAAPPAARRPSRPVKKAASTPPAQGAAQ